jgi:hypothetical protein
MTPKRSVVVGVGRARDNDVSYLPALRVGRVPELSSSEVS